MSRDLNQLSSRFRPLADALLAKCIEEKLDVVVITTSRTIDEQLDCVARGVSWTTNSMHLPQPPEWKAEAIDVAPRSLLVQKNWAPLDPLWNRMGEIGESVGLAWGGRWKGKKCDRPHFQMKA